MTVPYCWCDHIADALSELGDAVLRCNAASALMCITDVAWYRDAVTLSVTTKAMDPELSARPTCSSPPL